MSRILRADAERLLANVPEENVFWCCDGRAFRSMGELGQALATMGDEAFAFHANEQKNDFSVWVGDVIGDGSLAKQLMKPQTQARAARQVDERVAFLSSKL